MDWSSGSTNIISQLLFVFLCKMNARKWPGTNLLSKSLGSFFASIVSLFNFLVYVGTHAIPRREFRLHGSSKAQLH